MLTKTFWLQSGALALFVSIPLFRPIVLAHNLIGVVYAIFVLSFLILLANLNAVKYSDRTQLLSLLAYAGMSVIASLFAAQDIRLDGLGLLSFLVISYLLGVWLGAQGSAHWFFRWTALIFLPIAAYIVYQLSKSSFSYNTYYYWGSAAYKIDYLTVSLYAGILLIYFFFNGHNSLEKYGLPLFCFGFIVISGARYSIVFTVLAVLYITLRTAKKSPVLVSGGSIVLFLLLLIAVLFNDTLIGHVFDSVTYSLFRLESMSGNDTSIAGRIDLMQKASKIISENFSFGVGLAGSGEALKSNYPHNMLLEAFIDGGVLSMLPLLMFLVCSVYSLLMAAHEHKVWCLLLVLYVVGAFLKSFSIYESRVVFFLIGYATLTARFHHTPLELETVPYDGDQGGTGFGESRTELG